MKKLLALFFYLFLFIGILCAQHYKKDGTPDMRYKENKTSSYKSSSYKSTKSYSTSSSSPHLKKDGTPDMRYKENKTSTYKSSSTKPSSKSKSYTSTNSSVKRDKNGKIKRSESAKHQFMKQTGYPKGRPGYVVDHIIPLKKGGCDCPENMQWQTKEAAKAKDKWE